MRASRLLLATATEICTATPKKLVEKSYICLPAFLVAVQLYIRRNLPSPQAYLYIQELYLFQLPRHRREAH